MLGPLQGRNFEFHGFSWVHEWKASWWTQRDTDREEVTHGRGFSRSRYFAQDDRMRSKVSCRCRKDELEFLDLGSSHYCSLERFTFTSWSCELWKPLRKVLDLCKSCWIMEAIVLNWDCAWHDPKVTCHIRLTTPECPFLWLQGFLFWSHSLPVLICIWYSGYFHNICLAKPWQSLSRWFACFVCLASWRLCVDVALKWSRMALLPAKRSSTASDGGIWRWYQDCAARRWRHYLFQRCLFSRTNLWWCAGGDQEFQCCIASYSCDMELLKVMFNFLMNFHPQFEDSRTLGLCWGYVGYVSFLSPCSTTMYDLHQRGFDGDIGWPSSRKLEPHSSGRTWRNLMYPLVI